MSLKMYYTRANSLDFWDEFWKNKKEEESLNNYYENFKNKEILGKIFKKYLPKEGKILDAGCGSGFWTYWLSRRGYDVEGVDFSKNAIDFIKKNLPELSVMVGSVFDLDYPNDSFKSCLILGVIEYFEDGPEKILKEASRVLDKDGTMILRTLHFNPIRRLKNLFGFYKNKKGDFYQFAFTKKEIARELNKNGFKIVAVGYCDSVRGFGDEIFRRRKNSELAKSGFKRKAKKRLLIESVFNFPLIRFLFSHTMMIVAKKI